jgi:AraC-like DNA-binding protein
MMFLLFSFPLSHRLPLYIKRYVGVFRHEDPSLAVTESLAQEVEAAIISVEAPVERLRHLVELWHLHPDLRFKPLVLWGAGGWTELELVMSTELRLDAYLPGVSAVKPAVDFVRHLSQRQQELRMASVPQMGRSLPMQSRIMAMLLRQVEGEKRKVGEMADELGMSVSQFHKLVRGLTGTSPNEYIIKRRLEHAYAVLSSGGGRVSEVAYACGFTSVAYFCKIFKEQYGQTPGSVVPGRV